MTGTQRLRLVLALGIVNLFLATLAFGIGFSTAPTPRIAAGGPSASPQVVSPVPGQPTQSAPAPTVAPPSGGPGPGSPAASVEPTASASSGPTTSASPVVPSSAPTASPTPQPTPQPTPVVGPTKAPSTFRPPVIAVVTHPTPKPTPVRTSPPAKATPSPSPAPTAGQGGSKDCSAKKAHAQGGKACQPGATGHKPPKAKHHPKAHPKPHPKAHPTHDKGHKPKGNHGQRHETTNNEPRPGSKHERRLRPRRLAR